MLDLSMGNEAIFTNPICIPLWLMSSMFSNSFDNFTSCKVLTVWVTGVNWSNAYLLYLYILNRGKKKRHTKKNDIPKKTTYQKKWQTKKKRHTKKKPHTKKTTYQKNDIPKKTTYQNKRHTKKNDIPKKTTFKKGSQENLRLKNASMIEICSVELWLS